MPDLTPETTSTAGCVQPDIAGSTEAPRWLRDLSAEQAAHRQGALHRQMYEVDGRGPTVTIQGRCLLNLGGNDYLGLSGDSRLADAVASAASTSGVGSGASRLICGTGSIHTAFESRFAAFKHAEAALLFPTGYMANLAVISGLAGDGDLVALDKLCHASLIDGARLSGAEVRVYPHLHTEKLVRLLSRHQARHPDRRRLVVTDSVFSMDGDVADLQRLAGIADDHNAALIIDEAHATGIFGQRGSGMVEAQHVSDSPHISISTASKAMGCLGGMIAGPRCVIDTLVNRGRSFIYTTAPPATQVAAIDAALSIIESQPQLRERLMSLTTAARQAVADAFPHLLPPTLLDIVNQATPDLPSHRATPILPLVVGTEVRAMSLTMHMVNHDLFAPAIRPPTVPPGQARVRISLRADHPDDVIARLMAAIRTWPDHTS